MASSVLEELRALRCEYIATERKLVRGGALTSYTIGGRSYSMNDLPKLQEARRGVEADIAAEEAKAGGGGGAVLASFANWRDRC